MATTPNGPDDTDSGAIGGAVGMVGLADRALTGLDSVLWATRPCDDLLEGVAALEALRAHVAALEAELLAEVHARAAAKTELAWASTGDWFTHLAGLRRAQGKRAVDHAGLLRGERRATLEALRRGDVSPEQAAVIVDAIEQLPTNPQLRAEAEALLLVEAGVLDASELAKAARHLIHVIDPDRTERDLEKALDREERAAHLDRFLSIIDDGAGGVRLKGRGSVEDAAILKAALLPLTKPQPALDTGEENSSGTGDEGCSGEVIDPRDHGARLWDALIQNAQHGLDTDQAPECHGARPRVTVTIDYRALTGHLDRHAPVTLEGGIDWPLLGLDQTAHSTGLAADLAAGLGVTDEGLTMSAATARRLACDADIIPIALGGPSEQLDVGRTHRLVTPALWRALVVRDHHCAFPACTRPPVMCHAHHITHWTDGGPTSLDNMVLLCGHHHRTIHHTPWEVRLNPSDGLPEFQAPPRRRPRDPDRPPAQPPDWVRHRPRRE
ncbi:HNH endonuclease signature motif containing protein [Nocardioides pacificus]